MDEWLDKGDKLASIGSFVLALIALLMGKSLAIVLLLVALGLVIVALIFLLRRERNRVKERERFIAGAGFQVVQLDENQTFGLISNEPVFGFPSGRVWLGCVPFEILAQDGNVQIVRAEPGPNNAPQIIEIKVQLDRVKTVFFLINTGLGLKSWSGAKPGEGWDEKVVGRIQFEFQDDSTFVQELRLGHHLRDSNVGNQPWAVDQLRSEQAREVWLMPSQHYALDMLQVNFSKPRYLRRIWVSAQLETEQVQFPQILFQEKPIGPPFILIYGVTCWTVQ